MPASPWHTLHVPLNNSAPRSAAGFAALGVGVFCEDGACGAATSATWLRFAKVSPASATTHVTHTFFHRLALLILGTVTVVGGVCCRSARLQGIPAMPAYPRTRRNVSAGWRCG